MTRRSGILLGALTSILVMLSVLPAAVGANQAQERNLDPVATWRVHIDDADTAQRLIAGGYDMVEGRGPDYFLVIGDDAVAEQLAADGFVVTLDRPLAPVDVLPAEARAVPFFGGYRSVEDHHQHLLDVASAYPGLASVFDYGDSWNKVNGRAGPNDLMVICLTNKQPGDCQLNPDSAKPRAVIQAAIHARELQTSEVAWRLIDHLTTNYGVDGDITHIMDTTEVWIIPVANPDGREIVESGGNNPYLQRKNANDTFGNCLVPITYYDQPGVDLNRNATWGWGGAGVSDNPCAQTYNGTAPASEPEQQALEQLFTSLWPDQKGPNSSDPVASSATGSFITIHSYGELILLPRAVDRPAPNDAELRAFAFRMSHFNGYVTGSGPEILYGASGTTDDHAYFELGVASFTYELSPVGGACSGFTPNYSCIDAEIWPTNRDALLYSIKVAGAPYVAPMGPTTTEVDAAPLVAGGSGLTITAIGDDNAYGTAAGSFGRPAAQMVTAMEYSVDTPPSADGPGVAMASIDGAFDETAETATATIDTTGLASGLHTAYVRARNAAGFWGPITAVHFEVSVAGDADCDGVLSTADVRAILSYLAGSRTDTDQCPLAQPDTQVHASAADLDQSGTTDLRDALIIAQCTNSVDNPFCVAE